MADEEPGLCFLGLNFLYSATSDTITGVQRDARRIAKHLARHRPMDPSQATEADEARATSRRSA